MLIGLLCWLVMSHAAAGGTAVQAEPSISLLLHLVAVPHVAAEGWSDTLASDTQGCGIRLLQLGITQSNLCASCK